MDVKRVKNSQNEVIIFAAFLLSDDVSVISIMRCHKSARDWLPTRETETPRNGFPLVEARSELAPVGFYFRCSELKSSYPRHLKLSCLLFEWSSRSFEFVFKMVQGVSGVIIAANVPDKWISADAFSFPPVSHFSWHLTVYWHRFRRVQNPILQALWKCWNHAPSEKWLGSSLYATTTKIYFLQSWQKEH